jgi:hypothetical protein
MVDVTFRLTAEYHALFLVIFLKRCDDQKPFISWARLTLNTDSNVTEELSWRAHPLNKNRALDTGR